jgi:hypothetical protein
MYLNIGPKKTPPYASYKSWETFLERIRSDVMPLPQRLDKSVWKRMNFSGTTQSALKGALVFLNLATPNIYEPTDEFITLMESDNDQERRRFMSRIIVHAYSDLIDGIELARSTRGDVLDAFKSAGSGPETAEKAVSFFVGLALDAEIPLHTQLSTKPKIARRRKKFSGKKGQNELAGANLRTDILAQFGSSGVDGLSRLQGIHPAIIGLLGELPNPDDSWSQEAMASFLKAFEAVVRLVYEPDANSKPRDDSHASGNGDPLGDE